MNTLRQAAREYLAMRHSLGFKLCKCGPRLLDFVTFMEQRRASYITLALALAWAKQPADAHPDTWAQRLSYVRIFARHRSATDPRTQVPPAGLLPFRPEARAAVSVLRPGDPRFAARGAEAAPPSITRLDILLLSWIAQRDGSARRGSSELATAGRRPQRESTDDPRC